MGEIVNQKFRLIHGEDLTFKIIDTQLPERIEFKAFFEKFNQNPTVYRLMANKFEEGIIPINVKPFIEDNIEYKIIFIAP
jgi:hypothetical protein